METTRRPPAAATDRDLVVAFKSGDGRAYDEIFRRHSPKIRVVCSRRLGDAHDTEEAVQETFLRAYQALPRFNGQYKLGPWLNRIAINVCIDELRSRSRGDLVKPIEDADLEAERGPDDILASRRPEVIAALCELKPLHADALKLRALQGLSHEELAQQLAISPAQVKSLLHRARLAFKRVMRDASGFVLAPFAALRRGRKHGQGLPAGSGAANVLGVATVAHTSWPTAERLATGAVVAALALGSSSPAVPPDADVPRQQIRTVTAERDVAKPPHSTPLRTGGDAAPAAKVERNARAPQQRIDVPDLPIELSAAGDAVTPVTEDVTQELERHTNEKGNDTGIDDSPAVDPDTVREDVERGAAEAQETAGDVAHEVLGDS